MKYDICITLVNTLEKEEIIHCLKSLQDNSDFLGLNVAIAIVDNASNDEIKELSDVFPNTKVSIQDKNIGFGAAHNKAFKLFEADYYFILNPDTEFFGKESVLRKMYDFLESHSHVGMVGPKIIYPDGSLQYSCYRFPVFIQPFFRRTVLGKLAKGKSVNENYLMKDFDHNDVRPVDWLMGSAMFVRGRALFDVGGFDERYWMYAEDSDLCRKLWEKKWAVYYNPRAVIKHVHTRASSRVSGVIWPLIRNKYARTHVISWFKYFWKWRGNHKYYR